MSAKRFFLIGPLLDDWLANRMAVTHTYWEEGTDRQTEWKTGGQVDRQT